MRSTQEAERIFRSCGGMLRTSEALEAGIHPRTLYRLRDEGLIERVSRGLFRWADLPSLSNPDLVVVASRVPKGVICLVSSLAFHDITTQIPHEVHVALPRGVHPPRIEWPPFRRFWFSAASHQAGIEDHDIDGVPVAIYSAAKTVADCFKFRQTIGTDVAVEGLRLALERDRARPSDIEAFARVCRVERVVGPYLEALT